MDVLTSEICEKIKGLKSADEVLSFARKNNVDIAREEAESLLKDNTGKIADDELDNVAGGNCYTEEGKIRTKDYFYCHYFESVDSLHSDKCCKNCKKWNVSDEITRESAVLCACNEIANSK